MNYEEKYKQALQKAREIHRNEDEKRFDMEWLFPELNENEDERIRKGLVKAFGTIGKKDWGGLIVRDILIWLEKQGKQYIPAKEIILNVWELGEMWKEITKGMSNTEHGTQLDYILKHWNEGEHYTEWLEKQGGQSNGKIEPKDKKNEDDRIRKDIIRVFKGEISFTSEKENEKYIAWLEKQGTQTLT